MLWQILNTLPSQSNKHPHRLHRFRLQSRSNSQPHRQTQRQVKNPHSLLLNLTLVAAILIPFSAAADTPPDLKPLSRALIKQATYHSVIVKIRQTKKIPALTAPIKNTGKLWLKPGKAFRWQLGEPKSSTAIFDGTRVYLLDELHKSASTYSPSDRRIKPLLLMLGIGEGASTEKMTSVFRVTGVTTHGDHYIAAFAPKSIKLKRVLKSMVLQINTKTSFMERIEWVQKDGTIVTTEFFPPQINAPLPKGIFTFPSHVYQLK